MSSEHEIDVNLRALALAVNTFFQDTGRDLTAITSTQFAIARGDSVTIEPSELIDRNLGEVKPDFTVAMLCLACDKAVGEEFAQSVCLATFPFTNSVREVSVRGELDATDPDGIAQLLKMQTVDEQFPCVFSPMDLGVVLSIGDVLAKGPNEFVRAVGRLSATHRQSETLDFSLGTSFWPSLAASAIINNTSAVEKLLRVCAAVVGGQAQQLNISLRPIRSEPAPDSPQLVRSADGAIAWRATLTTRGPGWRLHFWRISSTNKDGIEFANVLRESDAVRIAD